MDKQSKKNHSNIGLKSWLILIFLGILWGSSFLLIKKGLIAFTPGELTGIRMFGASIFFLPVFLKYQYEINRDNIKYLIVVGVFGTALPTLLYAIAQTQVNSSISAVLNSLTPLFTLVLGILFFKTAFTSNKAIGVVLGLFGAGILILFGKSAGLSGNVYYGLFIILATMFYGLSANTVKAFLENISTYTISSTAVVMLGIPSFLYLLTTDFIDKMQHDEMAWFSFGAITLLALVSTVIGSLVFYKLVQETNALFGSMVAYLIPIVAMILGSYDGEPITIFHFIGVVFILGGVYISGK